MSEWRNYLEKKITLLEEENKRLKKQKEALLDQYIAMEKDNEIYMDENKILRKSLEKGGYNGKRKEETSNDETKEKT